MSDDLREALAKIKPGDEVTVALEFAGDTGTVSGTARDHGFGLHVLGTLVLGTLFRRRYGGPGPRITAVLDHKPHVPEVTAEVLDALPVWSVVTDGEGEVWVKRENGLWDDGVSTGGLAQWGPLTIRHPRDGAA